MTSLGLEQKSDKKSESKTEVPEVAFDEDVVKQYLQSRLQEIDNKEEKEEIIDDDQEEEQIDDELIEVSGSDIDEEGNEWVNQFRSQLKSMGMELRSENDDTPSGSDVDDNEDAPDVESVDLPDDDIWNSQAIAKN
jgi:hypothetical protein